MSNSELRARARAQLGNGIFSNSWMLALLVSLIQTAILSVLAGTAIGTIILLGPLSFGVCYCYLKQARNPEPMNIGDMFKGVTEDFARTFFIGLMTTIFIVLWSLLFVIPGIIAALSYSMAFYIAIDNPNLGWYDCIKASKAMMKGHKMDLLFLDLSFIGWYIVGALCFGFGTFWVTAYFDAAHAQFYNEVSKGYVIHKKETVYANYTVEEEKEI